MTDQEIIENYGISFESLLDQHEKKLKKCGSAGFNMIERLRKVQGNQKLRWMLEPLLEAADDIERLQASVDRSLAMPSHGNSFDVWKWRTLLEKIAKRCFFYSDFLCMARGIFGEDYLSVVPQERFAEVWQWRKGVIKNSHPRWRAIINFEDAVQ
jgi:hypothetical protein